MGKSLASNFTHLLTDKSGRQTPNKRRIADKLKVADLERNIFASGFKHKVWGKVFNKT